MPSDGTTNAPPRARPLSPHLQVYRLPLVAVLSITHRITGVGNSLGLLLLTAWLIAAASGPEAYELAMGLFGSIFGRFLLFCWSLSVFYHLCNGIRHMIWDVGYGLELRDAYKSGYAVMILAVLLTGASWGIAYYLVT
ncbi:MAG: succinate dehydrogenase, cytochrome b556 subunit [Pseudomonadota bacterium]